MNAQPSGPMRILHIFGRMDRGGAEMRTLELFRILNRQMYIFEFCALSGLAGELDDEITALGGKVHLLKMNAAFPLSFPELLRRRRFAAVHSHVHFFSGAILALAALAGVPKRIAHFRSTEDGKGNSLWRRGRNSSLKFLLTRTATDIIGVSEAALDVAMGAAWRGDARCQVIYSGVALDSFQVAADAAAVRSEFGFRPDATVVIHVGRMSPEKNHERLTRIFLRFARLVPDAGLLMVGKRDAAIEARIAAIAQAGGCTGRIVFAGVREDVGRLLASSDLMVFPSLREGLPGAVVEAAAAGIPVLASDIPGISELAGRLPGLRTISLARSDDDWAGCMLAAHHAMRLASARPARDFPRIFDVAYARAIFEQMYAPAHEQQRGAASV